MYIVLLCNTYGYLYTSIQLYSTFRYLRTSISSVTPTGDLNKYKYIISTSMCISLLYEFMKNDDICYCISVIVICLL